MANKPSRVCPKCGIIHDDIYENGGKYQICNRCLEELDDNYGPPGALFLEEEYDYAADDFNFRARREG
jgi:hypothetical protein